jgi:hypothetical protein
MRIDGLNMPLLRSWNLSGADFYKDVTPTAFDICRVTVTRDDHPENFRWTAGAVKFA